MRNSDRSAMTVLLVMSAGCLAVGCAPMNTVETSDPSAAGASGFLTQDSQASSLASQQAAVTAMFDGRAQLWSNGFVPASFGQSASGALATSLPDSGVDIRAGFEAYDAPGHEDDPSAKDLGIAAGSSTEVAVYNLHRSADQPGFLFVDHDPSQVAVRIAARYVTPSTFMGQAATTTSTIALWDSVTHQSFDGSPFQGTDVDYCVIVAPGGIAAGQGSHAFEGVSFRLDSNP